MRNSFIASSDHRAPSWDEPGGIRDLLLGLTEFGWQPVEEAADHRADRGRRNDQPGAGGAARAVGRAAARPAQSCAESGRHLEQVKAVGDRLGSASSALHVAGQGAIRPADHAQGPLRIMLRHMPRVGNLGLDMMLRTCTIQVNLDYSSEADMVKKFRVGLALQPVATALFANSPFTEGKPNGYKSFRSHIWEDTDPARTGMLPFVFDDGFGYERYCDYALDVPMYFVFRDGRISMPPAKLPRFPGRQAARLARRKADHGRLDRPSVDRIPRSAPEELP